MNRKLRNAALSAALLMGAGPALADVTVSGSYLKFGVNNGGSLIDFGTQTGLQFDPAGSGHFSAAADMLMPGISFAFYSLGVNGGSAVAGAGAANNPFSSVTSSVNSAGTSVAITSAGSYSGLTISQVITFDLNSNVIHTSAVLTNATSGTLSSVAYGVGIDPDPDGQASVYETRNTILGQGSAASVQAYGIFSGYVIKLSNTSGWTSTTASVSSGWTTNPYSLSSSAADDGNGDYTINLGYALGSLAPGQQVAIGYDYTVIATPVPEPAAYGMLLAGLGVLGMLGVAARRRRRRD